MTAVFVRVIAPDRASLQRAMVQLSATVRFTGVPGHPGRKGDWLAYGTLDAVPAPGEPTRRQPRLPVDE